MFNFWPWDTESSVKIKHNGKFIDYRLKPGETLVFDDLDTGKQQRKGDDMDKEKTLTELNRLSKQYMDDNYLVGKIKKDPTANCLYFSYQKSNGDTGRAALSFDPPKPAFEAETKGFAWNNGRTDKFIRILSGLSKRGYECYYDGATEGGITAWDNFEPFENRAGRVKELEGSLLRVYGMLSDGVGDTDVVAVNKMIEALNELRKITGGQ